MIVLWPLNYPTAPYSAIVIEVSLYPRPVVLYPQSYFSIYHSLLPIELSHIISPNALAIELSHYLTVLHRKGTSVSEPTLF